MMIDHRHGTESGSRQQVICGPVPAVDQDRGRLRSRLDFLDQLDRRAEQPNELSILGPDDAASAHQTRGQTELALQQPLHGPTRRNRIRVGVVVGNDQRTLVRRQGVQELRGPCQQLRLHKRLWLPHPTMLQARRPDAGSGRSKFKDDLILWA